MSKKSTPSDAFDEIQQVLLDEISDNTAWFVESVNDGTIDINDTANNKFYVIMFTS